MKRLLILTLVALCVIPGVMAIQPKNITISETEYGGHVAANAIDGNTATWAATANGYATLQICFPSKTNLTSFSAYHAYDGHDTLPRDVYLNNMSPDWTQKITASPAYGSWGTGTSNPMTMYGDCFQIATDAGWGGFNVTELTFRGYNATYSDMAPTVDFTCTPTNGTAPLTVSCVDNSTNWAGYSPVWNWSISPIVAGNIGNSGTNQNQATYYNIPGNYTVSHGLSTIYGSANLTKNNYITVTNSSDLVTTYFYTYNPMTSYEIHGSNIYLKDVENSSWINSTADADGRLGIATLSGHHIDAYGEATGFTSDDIIGLLADGMSHPLILFPNNATNVSAGNTTLYVSVVNSVSPGGPVQGASVGMTYNFPNVEGAITGESGMVSFTVPNKTTIYLTASKAGFTGVSESVYSGTGNGGSSSVSKILYITQKTVTPTITATTLPGGGTPTPITTVLPGCEDLTTQEGRDRCNTAQGGEMMGMLYEYGAALVGLCILTIIIGLMKMW